MKHLGPDVANLVTEFKAVVAKRGDGHTAEQIEAMATMYTLCKYQEEGMVLYKRQLDQLNTWVSTDLSSVESMVEALFVELYTDIFPFFYMTPTKPKGNFSGDWLEHLLQMLMRVAFLSSNKKTLDYKVGKYHNATEDHDAHLSIQSSVVISGEGKIQSDSTSLKKALASTRKNVLVAKHCTIMFPTNKCFKERDGATALDVITHCDIPEVSGSPTHIQTCIDEIIRRRCGVFELSPNVSVVIIGLNEAPYTTWNGEPFSNHGGSKGWMLSKPTISSIITHYTQIINQI